VSQATKNDGPSHEKDGIVEDSIRYVWRHGVSAAATRAAQGPIAVSGSGVHVTDSDGNVYLDGLSGGSAAATIGHGRKDVADAVHAQMTTLHWVSLRTFLNEPSVELGRRIAGLTDADLQTSFFVSSGSEAVESATQLAKSYHRARGNPDKNRFLYRKTGYHGTSLIGASASDNAEFRTWFAPLAPGFIELEACNPYRRPEGMTEEEYGLAAADAIEATILAEGPETIAGILAESIPAALVLVPPAGYLRRLREICDRYDILWIDDEVFIGFGRTGRWFGFEHYDVRPDIVTASKGITGGYVPLGAAIATSRVMDTVFGDGSSTQAKVSGHTYAAHPTACAAGLAVLDAIESEDLLASTARIGEWMVNEFRRIYADHPHVGDVRGKGFLIGVELVQDRATREAFPKSLGIGRKVMERAMSDLFMLRATGDVVTLFPALVTTQEDAQQMVAATCRAIDGVLGEL
jgi:putrescine aminotransferase